MLLLHNFKTHRSFTLGGRSLKWVFLTLNSYSHSKAVFESHLPVVLVTLQVLRYPAQRQQLGPDRTSDHWAWLAGGDRNQSSPPHQPLQPELLDQHQEQKPTPASFTSSISVGFFFRFWPPSLLNLSINSTLAGNSVYPKWMQWEGFTVLMYLTTEKPIIWQNRYGSAEKKHLQDHTLFEDARDLKPKRLLSLWLNILVLVPHC